MPRITSNGIKYRYRLHNTGDVLQNIGVCGRSLFAEVGLVTSCGLRTALWDFYDCFLMSIYKKHMFAHARCLQFPVAH